MDNNNNNNFTNEEIWNFLKNKIEKNGLTSIASISHFSASDWPNGLARCEFIPAYAENDVINAIAIAYRSGYLRAIKGRPFKIGSNKTGHSEPKKEKTGHWEPVDPNNLPNEGTRVRYARECESYSRGGNGEGMIALGDEGKFEYGKTIGLPCIHFDDGRFWNWVCFSNNPECLDMWVEDDE